MFNPFAEIAEGDVVDAELVELAKNGDRAALEKDPPSSRAVEIIPVVADALVWVMLVLCVVGLLLLCGKSLMTAFEGADPIVVTVDGS